jgi:hypothetical protein
LKNSQQNIHKLSKKPKTVQIVTIKNFALYIPKTEQFSAVAIISQYDALAVAIISK